MKGYIKMMVECSDKIKRKRKKRSNYRRSTGKIYRFDENTGEVWAASSQPNLFLREDRSNEIEVKNRKTGNIYRRKNKDGSYQVKFLSHSQFIEKLYSNEEWELVVRITDIRKVHKVEYREEGCANYKLCPHTHYKLSGAEACLKDIERGDFYSVNLTDQKRKITYCAIIDYSV